MNKLRMPEKKWMYHMINHFDPDEFKKLFIPKPKF